MVDNIDSRITPSLHPENIRSLEGYEDHAAFLGQVETAFSEAYEGLRLVWDARAAARANPVLESEAAQLIETQAFANKVFARAAKYMDSAKANLDKTISSYEQELAKPVTARAVHAVAQEVRSHVKAMDTSERMSFLQTAIAEGDAETAGAVLGAPPYLSGLSREMQGLLLRQYNEQTNPVIAKRVEAMKAARTLLVERGNLFLPEMEKAVGASPHKVATLREAKTRSERAFILKQD